MLHDLNDLSQPTFGKKSCRRILLLQQTPNENQKKPTLHVPLKRAMHIVYNRLKHVMASTAKAEVGRLFVNCQEAIPIQTACEEMKHPQLPMPIKTDNSMASGFANNTIKQQKSRAMDMRF